MYRDRRSFPLLVLIAVLPLFLFASFAFAFQANNRQQTAERNAHTDAQLLAARADGLLREALATSQSLASTGAISATDIEGATIRAEQFKRNNPSWTEVALDANDSRRRLIDLGRKSSAGPFLAPGQLKLSLRRQDDCRCILISRGFAAADGPRTLHVALSNDLFFKLLPNAYGDYEVAALVDEHGHFVARSIGNDTRFDTPASAHVRRANRSSARTGFYHGETLEGTNIYTAFARLEVSPWSTHIAMKAQRIDNPALAFWISIAVAVLLTLALAALLYVVARRHVEDTRAITRRIQEAQKLEALGQLTGGIAHDFNNLLTPIVGALDRLMRSDNLDSRERRFAKGAFESAERAAGLTSQLLTFSRRQKLEIVAVDVAAALANVCELAGQSMEVRHKLDCSTQAGTPPVMSDKIQLELALLNLILNARDSMLAGGVVEVRAAPVREGGRPGVAISVSDSGSGMDAETARRAQEPFFTTKAQGAGTGLGLAQVAEVAKQSAGRIEIDSEVGRGTVVRLILPAASVSAPTQTPAAGLGNTLPSKLNLLIVDDNADVRETLVQMVEADGHRVESVADGSTALTALSSRKPDLMLVDFAMPGLNGAETIAQAQELHPGLPCLLITGYWDSAALAASGIECPILRKPFTHDALRDAMAEALGN